MSLVAVVGDGCTTTALGLAAAWPLGEPCMVAEFDPAGGCLAAWLDVPRSPGLAEVAASSTPGSWATIQSMVQRAQSGVDVLVAPTRSVEAAAVVCCGDRLGATGARRARSTCGDRRRRPSAWRAVESRPAIQRRRCRSPSALRVGGSRSARHRACCRAARRNWRHGRFPRSSALIGSVPYSAVRSRRVRPRRRSRDFGRRSVGSRGARGTRRVGASSPPIAVDALARRTGRRRVAQACVKSGRTTVGLVPSTTDLPATEL